MKDDPFWCPFSFKTFSKICFISSLLRDSSEPLEKNLKNENAIAVIIIIFKYFTFPSLHFHLDFSIFRLRRILICGS